MQRAVWLGVIALDALVLAVAVPDVGSLWRAAADPAAWVDRVGADAAAATTTAAALWLVAVWVALGLLASLVARLPGATGRIADACARRVLPATLYRVAAGAAGLGVVLTPVAAGAAAPTGPTVASTVSSTPSAAWPTDAPLPAPGWPTTSPSTGASHDHPAAQPSRTPATVVVHPGDSLWSIAAAHLPRSASRAQVAAAWPRWYRANRAVIGADPALIRPGQVLHTPTSQESP